jgi:hypothetical protein
MRARFCFGQKQQQRLHAAEALSWETEISRKGMLRGIA